MPPVDLDQRADAARLMLERHLTSLPVIEAGRLVGILTDGDLLRRAELETAPSS
jgi:CBS domain-containing protein